MGKAKRAKLKRAEEQARVERQRELKKAERHETLKVTAIAVSILLVIAIIVTSCCLIVLSIRSTGNYLRNRVGITSENYEINNAIVSYFFRSSFNSSKSYYDYYQSYFGLDTSMALRDQTYSAQMTWFDYFMTSTSSSIANMLILAEAAHDAGVELTETDKAQVDITINAIKRAAEESGISTEKYIYNNYGLGVKESDIREALELNCLVQKYYYYVLANIEVTSDEINDYYEENIDDYRMVDYKTYTFEPSEDDDGMTAEEKGEKLADTSNAKDFNKVLKELIADEYEVQEDLSSAVEKTLVEGETYKEDNEYSVWLFDDEREVADTTVITDDDGNVSVYMIVKTAYRDESETKNVRHILFSLDDYATDDECKAAAEEVLAQFKGNATEEAFAELAIRYSADTGSALNGGLYEDVAVGNMVEEFENWLFDENRKAGDCEIVKTDYGYHIMYFVGNGRAQWEASIFNTLLSEKYSEIAEEYTEKYPVEIDLSKLKNIPDIA